MKIVPRLTAFALSAALIGATLPAVAATSMPFHAAQDPGQHYASGQGRWDEPPHEFRDVQRRGFQDGIGAARHDIHEGRRLDPRQHNEFRDPHVPPPDRRDYREAFRRGYDMARHHMHDRDFDQGHDHDHGYDHDHDQYPH